MSTKPGGSISLANDAGFGTGVVKFTGVQPGLAAVFGDRTVSNTFWLQNNTSFNIVFGDTTAGNEANPAAGRGSMTFLGPLDFSTGASMGLTPGSAKLYQRGSPYGEVFLGDIRNASSVAFSNASTFSFLTTPQGAMPKSYTGATTVNDNTAMVIDSDSSLGAVPGTPTTNLTLGTAASNVTNPSLWLQPGSGPVVLSANRRVVLTAAKAPAIEVNAEDELVISGSISGAATTLTKSGAGTLTLRGTNSFTTTSATGIQIVGGTVKLDYANMVGAGTIVTSSVGLYLGSITNGGGGGGTLQIVSGGSLVNQTLGALTINAKANEIQLIGSSINLTVGGTVSFTRNVGSTLAFTGLL